MDYIAGLMILAGAFGSILMVVNSINGVKK